MNKFKKRSLLKIKISDKFKFKVVIASDLRLNMKDTKNK